MNEHISMMNGLSDASGEDFEKIFTSDTELSALGNKLTQLGDRAEDLLSL